MIPLAHRVLALLYRISHSHSILGQKTSAIAWTSSVISQYQYQCIPNVKRQMLYKQIVSNETILAKLYDR